MELISSSDDPPSSPARTRPSTRPLFRLGAVQQQWHPDPAEHLAGLADGVATAAGAGAELVCLQELTLSPYFAALAGGPEAAGVVPERLREGRTMAWMTEQARKNQVFIVGVVVRGVGKCHTEGVQHSNLRVTRRRPVGPHPKAPHPRHRGLPRGPVLRGRRRRIPGRQVGGSRVGFPTCWDQWFPELARAYSLAGAELLVYPTAIGSEPDHPDFDTQPLWQQVIVGNGIANGTFMVAVNRVGTEQISTGAPAITFYGSSFISDPYGRVLVQAPRDRPAVIVADLDLDARVDWLELFPFLSTRRPDAYGPLVAGAHADRGGPST